MSPPPARIEMRLRELAQMFNSMDPSPFIDRDLDPDAEEYVVGWAREQPADREFELAIHLATPPPADRADGLQDAVRNYFRARALTKLLEFRQLMARGRQTLLIGVTFLAACLTLSGLVAKAPWGTGGAVLSESLTICGWVAMWRPLEIYLYGWWPVRREQRLFERLSRMQVRLLAAT
ncbi:MAG TPA: hypothetical protein VHD61_12065 [Lacunisphaera sp.]|nr:hypothetical protein [Lacunisphaera sp.]